MTYAIDGRKAKGTALVARKSVEALISRKEDFDITLIHYEKSDDPIYSQGIREIIFPTFKWKFLNRRFFRQIYYFIMTKDNYDIVHWFQPRVYPFFWLAPARKIMVTVHGAGDITAPGYFNLSRYMFNWTLRLAKKKVDAVIVCSEFAKKEVIDAYGFLESQVYVIYNGAESSFRPASEEKISAVKKKYDLPEKFFLNVSRLNPHKNVPRLIAAFEDFLSKNKSDLHLVNVGAGGYEKEKVNAIVGRSKYKDRIHLVGYIEEEDLPALYSAAFAFIFPSLNEGFGLPVIESMACGTPVVTSNITSLPEVSGKAAILVNPFNEKEIAEAMEKVAKDKDLREEMISEGLVNASKFTWEEMGAKLIKLYFDLCGR